MKIGVLGPGAMGLLYGAKLSAAADVILIGRNEEKVERLNKEGVTIERDGVKTVYPVTAVKSGECREVVDVVLIMTKAYQTGEALCANKGMIGPDTCLLTLQNGAGHEEVLGRFVDPAHVLIGTTAQGSSLTGPVSLVNSGLGPTAIGAIEPCDANRRVLDELAALMDQAGFECRVSDEILWMVWNKLMINASSSVLSGVLQVRQGVVAENEHAFLVCQQLIEEICATARALGLSFDTEEQIQRLHRHLLQAPMGYTSIYMDIRHKRKTEVDYICGAVLGAAKAHGVKVPGQEMMIRLVHAMEDI